jgi:hypothetical protein
VIALNQQSKELERAIQNLKDLGFDTLPGDSATEMVKAFIEQRQKDESLLYGASSLKQDILSTLETEKKEAYKTAQELKQRLVELIKLYENKIDSSAAPMERAELSSVISALRLELEELE